MCKSMKEAAFCRREGEWVDKRKARFLTTSETFSLFLQRKTEKFLKVLFVFLLLIVVVVEVCCLSAAVTSG